jgi:hypothetical protein
LFGRWFGKKHEIDESTPVVGVSGPRVLRHSGSWAMLRKRLQSEPGLHLIDDGYTSATNIGFLTGLGHSVFLSDLVHDAWTGNWSTKTDEEGNPVWNVSGFLDQALNFSARTFDVVLLWSALDYLPEPLIEPLIAHLFKAMNPGGQVLALFHTRLQGEETVHCRYHLTPGDEIEVQLAGQYPIQRVFSNRNIERLFSEWSGFRQFLAKDNVSEAVIHR